MGRAALVVTDFFFYGALCHAALLDVVLGRKVSTEPADLADHQVVWADGQAFAMSVTKAGAMARGVLVRGMSAEDVARLDYYEAGFAFVPRDLAVLTAAGQVVARVYFAQFGRWQAGAVWSLPDWQARFGAEVVATARDVMAQYGRRPAQAVLARYGMMLVRGAARVRATIAVPMSRRFAGDVQATALREPYAHFFAVEEHDLRFRRFDGQLSPQVTRAVFVSGDAVTVLPYDPVRDRVLLVEQFRAGPFVRGDVQPWQLEAVAGRIDPGETPEEAARREAVEEAGLTLGALLPVAQYYPSPGICAEYLYSYVGLTDLPDGAAGVFGVEGEAEDIRGHLVSFDDLMALVASGEAGNSPLILTAYWLAQNRARLRG